MSTKEIGGGKMYICYSRSKNESNAKAVLYHLENWGFTEGENDFEAENLMEVSYQQERDYIEKNGEALVIVTEQLIHDMTALVELDILQSLFMSGKIRVTAFVYGVEVSMLPEWLEWLKHTNIIPIEGMESVFEGLCQISEVHLEDCILKKSNFDRCKKTVSNFFLQDGYLKKIFSDYMDIEGYAVRTKIVLIYVMYCYITEKYGRWIQDTFYGKCIQKLFDRVECYTKWGMVQLKMAERSLFLIVCELNEHLEKSA